ncbi:hypothetical protein TH66_22430 [Carbonactinospora thermoautotrophica]|uniref:SAM-dependent chlorinase/fluorinase n=1 Tax=Carbonactinospora thermoautotrophica TaxID=1469144 RepID=A0A132NEZ1_9ACTN|nr:SAM-dependent chlorinase/fluorinase [Carbonactinospora thermoautotrophica]KWW98060.1 hypothetical protein TH66_22430 [Carbonactinospora thermoautotrophica]KWX08557.1 hypothetical protein TR74_14500 [Carbonactinospora thermoautotrophica]
MAGYRCISFLTDYGLADGFVGACHGVFARIAPAVRVIDITHLVAPGDVRRGAAVLAQTVPYLPPGVHVAVVDPGVGTARRGVAVQAGDHVFVGPDNGLLSWAADAVGGPAHAYELAEPTLMLPEVSSTFHGRDVFAPVAAHLATGVPLERVGPELPVDRLVRLPDPVSRLHADHAEGEVVTVDRYGNVQTSLTGDQVGALGLRPGTRLEVRSAEGRWEFTYGETFGSVPVGRLVAFVDSAGMLALAINGGNAANQLGLAPGDPVTVRSQPRREHLPVS